MSATNQDKFIAESPQDNAMVHVVFNAMSLRPGGGVTVLLGVIDGLVSQSDANYRISVICSAEDTRAAIANQQKADEVHIVCPNQGIFKRYFWTLLSMPKMVKRLNPDLFVSVNQYIRGISCPQVVYHLNLLRFMPIAPGSSLRHRLAETIRNKTSLKALKHASSNVFESDYLRQCAREIHSGNAVNDQVIYVGLPERCAEQPKLSPECVNRNQIVSLTNPNEHKNNRTLLKMLAELVQRRPEVDWRLVIAGGANAEKWKPYEAYAEELGVRERIEWLGFVNQDELTRHIRKSLCLVTTSLVESFCMVALEAMARGCPAIVADCTSMPESVGDAGLLAEPENPTSFSDCVLKYYDDESFRADYISRGFDRVSEFSWERCGEEFSNLFKSLLPLPPSS